MKKTFLGLFLLTAFCTPAFALFGHNMFEDTNTVCANHILVPTEMEAIKLKSQITTFDEFRQYARLYSKCPSGRNGGDLGCFGRKQMVKEFEEAAFNGNIGEVSDPVKTQFGYHLLWITKKY